MTFRTREKILSPSHLVSCSRRPSGTLSAHSSSPTSAPTHGISRQYSMLSHSSLFVVVSALLATNALAQTPVTLAAPGAPPDLMATFTGPQYVGSVNVAGAFAYQGVDAAADALQGTYLTHICNPDGTFDAVISVATYSATGALATQTAYCEHGVLTGTTYVSLTQAGTGCPLTAPYTGATNRTLTENAGSNVGTLSTTPFCNANFNSALSHTTANSPAPAPSPSYTMPSAGTTSVMTSDNGVSGAGGSTPAGNKK